MSIMEINDLLNNRNQFVGVITGEATRIEKCLYDNLNEFGETIIKPKSRPTRITKANKTISNGVKWATEDYKVYENRYRIPVMNIYCNDQLVIENEPVYFGNTEFQYNFKLGDIVVFSAIINKPSKFYELNGYNVEGKRGYDKLISYVNKDEWYIDSEDDNIYDREHGCIDLKYEFTKTILSNKEVKYNEQVKADSERVIRLEQEKETIKKQRAAEKRRQKRLEKQLKEEEEERRIKEEQERLEQVIKEREMVYNKLVSYYMGLKYSVDASSNKAAEIINKYYIL